MTSELFNDLSVIFLISGSFVLLAPVFYWLLTDVRTWQREHSLG